MSCYADSRHGTNALISHTLKFQSNEKLYQCKLQQRFLVWPRVIQLESMF